MAPMHCATNFNSVYLLFSFAIHSTNLYAIGQCRLYRSHGNSQRMGTPEVRWRCAVRVTRSSSTYINHIWIVFFMLDSNLTLSIYVHFMHLHIRKIFNNNLYFVCG